MFIRYQYYKGYIENASYEMLNMLEKDIKEDVAANRLDLDLANRLLNLIANERKYNLNIAII